MADANEYVPPRFGFGTNATMMPLPGADEGAMGP
jgi:hypothetical protein